MITREMQIAEICHEANKAICEAADDFSQKEWSAAEEWQRACAIEGVTYILNNPDCSPGALHEEWCKSKREDGWVYGWIKDPLKKTHPCLVSFEKLPFEDRVKDSAFKAIVLSVSKLI